MNTEIPWFGVTCAFDEYHDATQHLLGYDIKQHLDPQKGLDAILERTFPLIVVQKVIESMGSIPREDLLVGDLETTAFYIIGKIRKLPANKDTPIIVPGLFDEKQFSGAEQRYIDAGATAVISSLGQNPVKIFLEMAGRYIN